MKGKNSYPTLQMDECIDSVGEANVFTTLDAHSIYWEVASPLENCRKTAVVSTPDITNMSVCSSG